MSNILRELAAANPSIIDSFGGWDAFEKAATKIERLDEAFAQRNGTFFHLGSTPQETASAFTKIQIEEYRNIGRPSLPALVAHHLDSIGLSPDNPHYKAAVLVAARAEADIGITPQYHNTNHFADVAAQTAEFLKRNNVLADAGVAGVPKLSAEEIADSIAAAVGHDLEHPGGKNGLPGQAAGEVNHYRLEEQSFNAMLPLLEAGGLESKAIDDIHVMILTTSPNGPHGILKAVAKAHHEGQGVDWAKIDPNNKFPELKVLADDPKLTERAAILEDSDLGGSAFADIAASIDQSARLTQELQERGYRNSAGQLENLNGPFAREGFFQFLVGEGPASFAAQEAVGINYKEMRAATQLEIAEIKARTPEPQPPAAGIGSKFIESPKAGDAPPAATQKPAAPKAPAI